FLDLLDPVTTDELKVIPVIPFLDSLLPQSLGMTG
ncbi:MAG: hypothetical protein ACI9VN_003144, partial [Patescibacteria group bacterium]